MRVAHSQNSTPSARGLYGWPARGLATVLATLLAVTPLAAETTGDVPAKPAASASSSQHSRKIVKGSKGAKASPKSRKTRAGHAARAARTARIRQAFVASSELRPMAQQLATMRTPAAYAGVTRYAHAHTGEAGAAAYLALGHAYLVDHRFSEASENLKQARQSGEELADYADYLGAQADHQSGNEAGAAVLLHGFATRYPDSIFNLQAPELEATVLLAQGNAAGARKVLAEDTAGAARPAYQLAEGEVEMALGQEAEAEQIFRKLLLGHPLSTEAQAARAKLTALGAELRLTVTELRSLGDAYYNAGRYAEAAEQYRALEQKADLSADERNGFAVDAAACELKLKRLSPAQVQGLADTADEHGARRLYLLMELARNRDDGTDQQRIVALMETRFPKSPWLAEALFSSGNMYLLKKDFPTAISYYSYLATHFPDSANAPAAHWRAGWLSYRQGLYADASRLFDEQIKLYPGDKDTVAAIYWRGRLYETQDHKAASATSNYRALVRAYQHFFYTQLARRRLQALGNVELASQTQMDKLQAPPVPVLEESFPEDSPHLAKAKLVANAGLNEYVAQEIAADPDSGSWSALAEAQIYASYGETYRAMRSLKKALPFAMSAPISSIPLAYWRILFPEAWWETIKSESAKNNLDPFLVASLIRQESEFNPNVISYANAYGLMQVEPATGKQLAKEEGMSHFQAFQLLDPETNIRLGTRYLRKLLDRFGGVEEYALAAYNAGDYRVVDWQAAGPYGGLDEFVESIPFTQTREYVEAILRNKEIYRSIDEAGASHGSATLATTQPQ